MWAWWAYWFLITVSGVAWLAAAVIARSSGGIGSLLAQPLWAIILLLPPLAAGINLIAYRQRHEEVCRIEVTRHRWLALATRGGYSARTFALTGVVLVVFSVAVTAALLSGSL
jgi:hypothetical protein